MTIVNTAEAAIETNEPYDRVYCVFDRDGHANYDAALEKLNASNAGRSGKLRAITSIPCFEVWVLLHYSYSTAAFTAVGTKSSCDHVIEKLRKSFTGYTKGARDAYAELSQHTDIAIANAKKLESYNLQTGSNNPATLMHDLVEYLRDLKKPKVVEAT